MIRAHHALTAVAHAMGGNLQPLKGSGAQVDARADQLPVVEPVRRKTLVVAETTASPLWRRYPGGGRS